MSLLESKAKTYPELNQLRNIIEVQKGGYTTTSDESKKEFDKQKWVPLEDYQVLSEKAQKLELNNHNAVVLLKVADNKIEKLEDEIQLLKEGNYDLLYTNAFLQEDKTDLEKQIVEANKILDEAPERNNEKYWTPDKPTRTFDNTRYTEDVIYLVKRLREALTKEPSM